MSESLLSEPGIALSNTIESSPKQTFPQYRTIHQAVSYIKSIDPECSITECMVRKVINDGQFKAKKVGSKYVIDLKQLLRFFDIYGEEE